MSFCFCQLNPYSGDPLPPLAIQIFESDMTPHISSAPDKSDVSPIDQDILTLRTSDESIPISFCHKRQNSFFRKVGVDSEISSSKIQVEPGMIEGCIPFEIKQDAPEAWVGLTVKDWFKFDPFESQVEVQIIPHPVQRSFPVSKLRRLYALRTSLEFSPTSSPESKFPKEKQQNKKRKKYKKRGLVVKKSYFCPTCGEVFDLKKERKAHMLEEGHGHHVHLTPMDFKRNNSSSSKINSNIIDLFNNNIDQNTINIDLQFPSDHKYADSRSLNKLFS